MKRELFPARETVEVATLPAEEQHRLTKLESKTDQVYALRTQLANFYRAYKNRLPKNGKHRLLISEIQDLVDSKKSLPKILGLPDTDELLEGDPDFAIKELDTLAAFEEALVASQTLQAIGGELKATEDTTDKDVARYYQMRWQELASAMRAYEGIQEEARRLESMREKVLNSHAHLQV